MLDHGLDITFHLLATTRNEAAVAVLDAALRIENPAVRRRAIDAVIARRSLAAGRTLIERWDSLSEAERAKLDGESDWLVEGLSQDLRSGAAPALRAIQIARALQVDRLAVPLIELAEGHDDERVQEEALEAVWSIVAPIGAAARQDRDRPSLRGPILARLEVSLNRYPTHRKKKLVDAFLAISTWTDRQLWAVLSDDSIVASVVRDRLGTSQAPEVISLLAAAVGQRRCPPAVRVLIAIRQEPAFRDALLDAIGGELHPSVRMNLKAIGMPACCRNGVHLMEELTGTRRTSLALLYSVTDSDAFRVLEMLINALENSPADSKISLLHALPEVPRLDGDRLLRAAVFVSQPKGTKSPSENHGNEANASLLRRLLHLLEDGDATMERVVQRVLAPLHTENVIDQMERFRPTTQRKIGQVVMRTDADAVDRLRERLRHPVLNRRLQAIAATEAFDVIDELSALLIKIAKDDHQEARIAAIAVLSRSSLPEAWTAIHEIAAGPDSSIRDAALATLSSSRGEIGNV